MGPRQGPCPVGGCQARGPALHGSPPRLARARTWSHVRQNFRSNKLFEQNFRSNRISGRRVLGQGKKSGIREGGWAYWGIVDHVYFWARPLNRRPLALVCIDLHRFLHRFALVCIGVHCFVHGFALVCIGAASRVPPGCPLGGLWVPSVAS